MSNSKKNKLQIRNSTVDFLVFTNDAREEGLEVRVQDKDVWLTQNSVCAKFAQVKSQKGLTPWTSIP